jgi:hypothetical protein
MRGRGPARRGRGRRVAARRSGSPPAAAAPAGPTGAIPRPDRRSSAACPRARAGARTRPHDAAHTRHSHLSTAGVWVSGHLTSSINVAAVTVTSAVPAAPAQPAAGVRQPSIKSVSLKSRDLVRGHVRSGRRRRFRQTKSRLPYLVATWADGLGDPGAAGYPAHDPPPRHARPHDLQGRDGADQPEAV